MQERIEKIIQDTGIPHSKEVETGLVELLTQLDDILNVEYMRNIPSAYFVNLLALKQLKNIDPFTVVSVSLAYALDINKEHRTSLHHALKVNHFLLDQTAPGTRH